MKTINDILNYFEEFAPCATQMSFDNAGLIVGDKYTAVSRVLVALDITEDVVNEAESLGCELIISHHPVIFAPYKKAFAFFRSLYACTKGHFRRLYAHQP